MSRRESRPSSVPDWSLREVEMMSRELQVSLFVIEPRQLFCVYVYR